MAAVSTVLIVGGGTVGCALAALLARDGVSVEIVEIKSDWTTGGSGITLQGNALRVLQQVGVWEQVRTRGFAFDGLGLRSSAGELLAELPTARTGGPDLPATLGMDRPQLAAVLSEAAKQAGATVRLGATVQSLRHDGTAASATFTDGGEGRYDLVVGADGIRSGVRAQLGIDLAPQPTGISLWRVRARRPPGLERTELCYDGPCYIAGYCPTGENALYAYLAEDTRERTRLPGPAQLAIMRQWAGNYHGFWDFIREDLTNPENINYTAFESLLLPAPWHRGRAVLIGDAAHACPPTLAQGAAMGLEDAAVLAELLLTGDRLDESLWRAFTERRFERVRTVVESSLQIVRWLTDGAADADVPGLMARLNQMLAEPA